MYIKTLCEVCKVLTGAELERKTFKTKLIQLKSDTPYNYILPFQFLIMSLKVLRFSLVLT